MNKLNLHIKAIDTLMFRDGRPFNQNDAGASKAVSVFPPYPPTIVGAVRATLWKQLGDWKKEILGDGTNWQSSETKLANLRFSAPILLKNGDPVFPVPLHILEGKIDEDSGNEKKQLTRLLPGKEVKCDLDKECLRLPVPKNTNLSKNTNLLGIKPIEDRWVNASGMEKILNGKLPDDDDLVKIEDLWTNEPRVGIGINPDTRTVLDAQLYMASHVRMVDDVSLYVCITGCDENIDSALRPLAGEHRMAEIYNSGKEIKMPAISGKLEGDKWCAVALSPVVPDVDGKIRGLNSGIVSACLGKTVAIGGWDSKNKQPIPLKQCIPAGSVWFIEGRYDESLVAIGQAQEWGFGQILIGKW